MSELSLIAISTIFSDASSTFVGEALRDAEPVLNKRGRPIFRKGGQCGVTKLRYRSGEFKALRMWQAEFSKTKTIYEHIAEYIRLHPAPYLLNTQYVPNAVAFNGEYYPVLLMDWCSGCSLKDFIVNNLTKKEELSQLKMSLTSMFKDMNVRGISHGDIQHNNICIYEDGTPVLIDYDSLFVPSLNGFEDICLGLRGFQLPNAREKNKYLSPKSDYFAQLIVILTIECLIQDPTLWSRYYDDDDDQSLLFKRRDFTALRQSKIYGDVKRLQGEAPVLIDVLEQYLQKCDIGELWPFYEYRKDNQSLYCINCGQKVIEANDKYCTECGSLIYV